MKHCHIYLIQMKIGIIRFFLKIIFDNQNYTIKCFSTLAFKMQSKHSLLKIVRDSYKPLINFTSELT